MAYLALRSKNNLNELFSKKSIIKHYNINGYNIALVKLKKEEGGINFISAAAEFLKYRIL